MKIRIHAEIDPISDNHIVMLKTFVVPKSNSNKRVHINAIGQLIFVTYSRLFCVEIDKR